MKKITTISKLTLVGSFSTIVSIFLISSLYADYRNDITIQNTPDSLKLKASKERIATFAEYAGTDGEEKIIQYIYGTDELALSGGVTPVQTEVIIKSGTIKIKSEEFIIK